MVVKAPTGPVTIWKSRVFDIYFQEPVVVRRAGLQISADKPGLAIRYPATDPSSRQDVEQTFTMVLGASRLCTPRLSRLRWTTGAGRYGLRRCGSEDDQSVGDSTDHSAGSGEEYSVLSSISVASAPFLRDTPTNYPEWVKALDLQVPANITARTRALAQQIVQQAGAKTAYDKAKALERWLRKNIKYNEALRIRRTIRNSWIGYCSRKSRATAPITPPP